jgi:hypothetical protein
MRPLGRRARRVAHAPVRETLRSHFPTIYSRSTSPRGRMRAWLSSLFVASLLAAAATRAQVSPDLTTWVGMWSEAARVVPMRTGGTGVQFGEATVRFTATGQVLRGVVTLSIEYAADLTVKRGVPVR